MRLTLVSSCGLVLESAGQTLLVDALAKNFRCFYGLPMEEYRRMLDAQGPYATLCGVICTHAHPDHYNATRTGALCAARGIAAFVPEDRTPPELHMQMGPFAVEYHSIPHTPVAGWDTVANGVFYITDGSRSVYLTADAAPEVQRHRQILHGRRVDAAFWNGQYLSQALTRELLRETAEKNYIYHIPIDAEDVSGIRRKCEKNMTRFAQELRSVTLLERYPTEIVL